MVKRTSPEPTAVQRDAAVQAQYKTTQNLDIRISIHAKYSTNRQGFGNWIFSHYDLPADAEILELGCGTGSMWKERLPLPESGTHLLLTDFSEGMLASARTLLGEHQNLSYAVMDIQDIPCESGRFDRVIANMMLYHVPDLDKGLSEVKRVLADDGVFYCATYGENGIVPYIAGLLKNYGVIDKSNKVFTLQNGEEILRRHFSAVQRFDYKDSLAVTDLDDLLDYLGSLISGTFSEVLSDRETVKQVLKKEMVNGVLHIPKENGMFICRKK